MDPYNFALSKGPNELNNTNSKKFFSEKRFNERGVPASKKGEPQYSQNSTKYGNYILKKKLIPDNSLKNFNINVNNAANYNFLKALTSNNNVTNNAYIRTNDGIRRNSNRIISLKTDMDKKRKNSNILPKNGQGIK